MAEALETTVLAETCKKEDVWITSPPNVLENNLEVDEEEEENFEEMSKQRNLNDDSNEFEEMTKNPTAHENDTNEDEDEIHFKIKEEEDDDDDDQDDDEDQQSNLNKLIDVETTATSANLANLAQQSVDLLGNDIVKSIEKANLLYDGGDQPGLGQIFTPLIGGTGSAGTTDPGLGCSSEDDMEFKPVTSGRKNKKKQKNKNCAENSPSSIELGSSFADSESSDAQMQEKSSQSSKTEGWSFEADDLDVNKLLSEVIPPGQADTSCTVPVVAEIVEEKAALEDVFKFDSELGSKSDQDSKVTAASAAVISNNMSTSLNYDDSNNSDDKSNSLSQSMTYGAAGCSTTTTSNSESSVGNSPNPRAASKKKGKSKKKKR